MGVAQKYGNMVRRNIENRPALAGREIRLGLHLEGFRCAHLQTKSMPEAYQFLNEKAIKLVANALDKPSSYAWTNIFAPVEILESFGMTAVSMECLASYLAGFYLEDYFIDRAEDLGIPTTLCSYHKNFIGAVESGVIPLPPFAMTTSTVCDGNIQTFRYLQKRFGVNTFILDVPWHGGEEAEVYLEQQLRDMISKLEAITGKKFDETSLSECLVRENESKRLYLSFLNKRSTHSYPGTLTLQLFLLFTSHLSIGSEWALEFYRRLNEDIEKYPPFSGKRILWVHLTPFAQPTLRSYFNYSNDYQIILDDLNADYIEPLDADHPLRALSKKMIYNLFNGDFNRKADACVDFARRYQCDAAIEFCHWGCKQSCGGAQILKRKMQDQGIPFLILDGDAIDRRGTPDGQIKTRIEAFWELLKQDGQKKQLS